MKKIVSILGAIVSFFVFAAAGSAGKEVYEALVRPSPAEIEQKMADGMKKSLDKLKQRLPLMVDEDTRLDYVDIGPGAQGNYYYSFPKYSSQQVSGDALGRQLRPEIAKAVCSDKAMRKTLRYGARYSYMYRGNDGIEITHFLIQVADCVSI